MDFGAAISGEFAAASYGESAVGGNTILAPWLAFPINDISRFYLSAGLNMDFDEGAVFIPELFALEYSVSPIPLLEVRAGRIGWQDVTGFTAKGFFDGAEARFNLGMVDFGAAVFYTGLLYKGTANINATKGDPKDYHAKLDWKEFAKTYSAPRRLLASLHWQLPGLPYMRGRLFASAFTQVDLSDAKDRNTSFYFLARHALGYKRFDLDVAGAVSFGLLGTGFAFTAEGGWQTGLLNDRLSVGLRWASGEKGAIASYFPVTMEVQGVAIRPLFAGIMVGRVKYEARIFETLSAHAGARYFFRTDSVTFKDVHIENDKYSLGLEFDIGAIWAPFSDLSFSLVGGVFLPGAGGAMKSDSPARFSITVGSIFSF